VQQVKIVSTVKRNVGACSYIKQVAGIMLRSLCWGRGYASAAVRHCSSISCMQQQGMAVALFRSFTAESGCRFTFCSTRGAFQSHDSILEACDNRLVHDGWECPALALSSNSSWLACGVESTGLGP
jgi:hypothetical protein